jgi:hypothetical protein
LGADLPGGRLDSVVVEWPDGAVSRRYGVAVNQRLTLAHPRLEGADDESGHAAGENADNGAQLIRRTRAVSRKVRNPWLVEWPAAEWGLDWRHEENYHNDFDRQPLLFHMRSTEGPAVCSAAGADGRPYLYLGGARNQPGTVLRQNQRGAFERVAQPALEADRISEDTDCAWFDAEGDGDVDLYVASGGSEFPASSTALMDRLYLNDGDGRLTRSNQMLIPAARGFEPTGTVAPADVDGDGDIDLFVGARMQPFAFGLPVDGHLLINDGSGQFTEATDALAPALREVGLITDAQWADVDGDDDLDLLLAGEWMPLTLLENRDGALVLRTDEAGLAASTGWWNAIELVDLDNDGDEDLIAANHGLNSRFRATAEEPIHMWVDDFDGNGTVQQVIATHRDGLLYPMALRHDLVDQIRPLEQAYPTYESFAGETVHNIFSEQQLQRAVHHQAEQLQSVVGWNDGQGRFRTEPLPREAQLAPMYGITTADIDANGTQEILMGGNLYEAKPEVGRYAASYGAVLKRDSTGFRMLPFAESGFWVSGPIRVLETLRFGGQPVVMVARNDAPLKGFAYGQ